MSSPKPQPTQDFLPFSDIRDGLVILKDGSLRMILLSSATNFALKSEEEQNAVIFGYQSFINSLAFPIQIVMQSRRLDLTGYLKKLAEAESKQSNDLLRAQTAEYRNFISQLITVANIMDKKFFVVIPYFPGSTGASKGVQKGKGVTSIPEVNFKQYQQELNQRGSVVAQGLGSLGIRVAQLSTQEVIELLYSTYNQEVAPQEPLADVTQLTAPVIERAPPPGPPNGTNLSN